MAFRKIIMPKDPDISRQIDHMVAEQLQIEAGTGISFTTSGPKRTIASTVTGSGTAASTVTSQTTYGTASAVGTDTEYARQDHAHGTPATSYVMMMTENAGDSPVDGSTYYLGDMARSATISSVVNVIPKTGTIKVAYLRWNSTSAAGSNEDVSAYIRINDTTDTLIQTIGSTDAIKTFTNTGLSIAVTAADTIAIKIVCPTWTTNPTGVLYSASIYFE